MKEEKIANKEIRDKIAVTLRRLRTLREFWYRGAHPIHKMQSLKRGNANAHIYEETMSCDVPLYDINEFVTKAMMECVRQGFDVNDASVSIIVDQDYDGCDYACLSVTSWAVTQSYEEWHFSLCRLLDSAEIEYKYMARMVATVKK